MAAVKYAVAIFAHNEELAIVQALQSISPSDGEAGLHAYVLINGCTDRTERVVKEFARKNHWVKPITIEIGDKANAWNVFVHDVAQCYETNFFLDGDVEIEPGALNALHEQLARSPEANAAAAIPASGRNRDQMAEYVTERRLILGNLYALRGDFVRRVQETGVRIPLGYIGDDGIITSLVKWDLNPTGKFCDERVTPCVNSKFRYRSLSPFRIRDLRLYWRRRVRYSLRHFQHEMLVPLLTSGGIRAMPDSVTSIYLARRNDIEKFRPRGGLDSIFDRIALRKIRHAVRFNQK
jgi:glycosyltransferase involved in cell wall biosynthesis